MARTSWMILVLLAGCAAQPTPVGTGSTPVAGTPTGSTPAAATPIAEDPVGRVFLLDLSKGEWAPTGVMDVVAQQFPHLLLGVEAIDPSVVLRLAQTDGRDGEQDLCVPTTELTGAFADPHFEGAGGTWTFEFAGLELLLVDLQLGGDFAVDAERIEGLSLAATTDGLPVLVEGLALPWLVDLPPLVPRTEADIAADPACP